MQKNNPGIAAGDCGEKYFHIWILLDDLHDFFLMCHHGVKRNALSCFRESKNRVGI